MRRYVFLALAMLLSLTDAQSWTGACLTTPAPSPPFVPPTPYDALGVPSGAFWYGTDALWTKLVPDGVWHLANNVDKHNGYITKLVFWSKGFDLRKEPEPQFTLTARRIDNKAPVVAITGAIPVFVTSRTPAMMTCIRIPSAGCWEITASYRSHALAFIVLVEP